jgi:hypothetical protein
MSAVLDASHQVDVATARSLADEWIRVEKAEEMARFVREVGRST